LHLVVDDVEGARRRVRETLEKAGIPVESIDRVLPSLEDVFIHYIEKEEAAQAAAIPS
jgi:CheY-like chemotaxis protein